MLLFITSVILKISKSIAELKGFIQSLFGIIGKSKLLLYGPQTVVSCTHSLYSGFGE